MPPGTCWVEAPLPGLQPDVCISDDAVGTASPGKECILMKKHRKLLVGLIIAAVCLVVLGVMILVDQQSRQSSIKLTAPEAEAVVGEAVKSLPLKVAKGSVSVADQVKVTVQEVTYGQEKDIILQCTYETVDILSVYQREKQAIFTGVYGYYLERSQAGTMVSSTHILGWMGQEVADLVAEAPAKSGEITLTLYDTGGDTPELWLDDDTVNTLLGGLLTVRNDVNATETLTWEGEQVSIKNNNSLRRGISDCFGLNNYSSDKPDASTPLMRAWHSFANDFYRNFIEERRWTYLTNGLATTLAITGLSLLLGVVIGFVTAIIRTTHDKEGKLSFLNWLGTLYVTIIRGTPVMIQLMIIYFVLLLPIGIEKFPAAVLCFGLNSGAYVSEIIRGGIMAVDNGQMEAGRSLGFGYVPTMIHIVLPQAFKAVLPSLCNEFIALLKETSVAFYIGVADLTQGGLKIRSITYSNFLPLIAIAAIYLVLVLILTRLVSLLEKRLRRSER